MFPLNFENYDNSHAVMCCVTTNAKTGNAEYFYPKDLRNGCDELKASCALPFATKPVQIGKDLYYDGGLTDSIPLKRAFDDGCEKCVVILTQDINYVKTPIGHEKAIRKMMKRYPMIAERIITRHTMYNQQRNYVFQQRELGNALVICSDQPLNVPTLEKNPQKLRDIYNIGYKQGLENIDKVKEFIRY
jgi:predicted patatin/cPLA2 family phospholipase